MASEIDLHIGRRLRRRRRVLGLTQQQLGERLNIRFQQVQKYECGANRISAARLWYLAKALEIDLAYFYDGFEDADGHLRGTDVSIDVNAGGQAERI